MCTVVVRWEPHRPTQILALRDELTRRDFDDPGRWWPDDDDVVGGRDRQAGGTWCASRISTGVTALVLNRPAKRVADPGAPSRGVLPLVAAVHEDGWTACVEIAGMASFALVVATPVGLTAWDFDGSVLARTDLDAGTHMITSGGAEDGKAARYLADFERAAFPAGWRELVEGTLPQDDLTALVVRRQISEDVVYATVFGQLIEAEPGRLHLDYSRTPWTAGTWTSRVD